MNPAVWPEAASWPDAVQRQRLVAAIRFPAPLAAFDAWVRDVAARHAPTDAGGTAVCDYCVSCSSAGEERNPWPCQDWQAMERAVTDSGALLAEPPSGTGEAQQQLTGLLAEARGRYWTDATFHSRAVLARHATELLLGRDSDDSRDVAHLAAIVALALAGGYPATPADTPGSR